MKISYGSSPPPSPEELLFWTSGRFDRKTIFDVIPSDRLYDIRVIAQAMATAGLKGKRSAIGARKTRSAKAVMLRHVDQRAVRELGQVLLAVLNGADAHRMFRQHLKRKTAHIGDYREIALCYYSQRAMGLATDKSDAKALKATRQRLKCAAELSDGRIRRICRQFREQSIDLLKRAAPPEAFKVAMKRDGVIFAMPIHSEVLALEEYLRKKSPR